MKFIAAVRRMLSRFKIQAVIILFFSTVIPVVAVQLINYHLEMKIITDKNNAIMNDNFILSRNNANTVISKYQQVLYQITTDEAFQEYMEQLLSLEEGTSQYNRTFEKIQARIFTHILMYPEVQSVAMTDVLQRRFVVSQKRRQDQPVTDFFLDHSDQIYSEMMDETYPRLSLIFPDDPNYVPNAGTFYISYRTVNYETMKTLGVVSLFIDSTPLNAAVNNQNQATYAFTDKIIMTENHYILCSRDNKTGCSYSTLVKENPYLGARGLSAPIYEDDNILINKTSLDGFNLSLLYVVDKRKLFEDVRQLWFYSTLSIAAVMLLTLILVYLSSSSTVQSINRMTHLMNSLASDSLDILVPNKSNNEIRSIEISFEQMVGRIKNLLAENDRQYRRILEITKASKEAELKSLELQINPHFLFNTIDTINWMAIRKGDYDISEQLNSLAYILRYTVYNVNGVVTVRQETEWVHQYLRLQQNRFKYKFDYDIHVSPDIMDCKIHKLILQPFLENAIIHGFDNIDYQGMLVIEISAIYLEEKGRHLVIQISDNGVGIDEETAESIREMFRTLNGNGKNSIGMQNIALRLAGYYEGRAWIDLRSGPAGSRFILYIPQKEDHRVQGLNS